MTEKNVVVRKTPQLATIPHGGQNQVLQRGMDGRNHEEVLKLGAMYLTGAADECGAGG